jgi:hypothetical protein
MLVKKSDWRSRMNMRGDCLASLLAPFTYPPVPSSCVIFLSHLFFASWSSGTPVRVHDFGTITSSVSFGKAGTVPRPIERQDKHPTYSKQHPPRVREAKANRDSYHIS